MRIYLVPLILLFTFSACQKPADTPSAEAKRFPFVGKVVSVDKVKKKATIAHEAIPGYMDAMTMAFPIHDDWVWNDLTPGSEIHADLVVDNSAKDPFYLEKLTIIAAPDPNAPPPADQKAAIIGKQIPDFTLTNQDGRKISPADFRGKALAITFIYARCPLPDYCIKMSTNFSDLANQVKADAEWKNKVRLLSISFDPENDTPAKLRSYGAGYLGNQNPPDFSVWQLAVGSDAEVRKVADFFGLDYQTDESNKTQIVHNLRTAVIDPQGNVTKIYSDNEWAPAELLAELKSSYSPQK